jgi:hypothetical protein
MPDKFVLEASNERKSHFRLMHFVQTRWPFLDAAGRRVYLGEANDTGATLHEIISC